MQSPLSALAREGHHLAAPSEIGASDPLGFVLSLNIHRRHLNATQLAFLALRVEQVEAERAKERQLAALKQNAAVTPKLGERGEVRGEAAKIAAAKVGASPPKLCKAGE